MLGKTFATFMAAVFLGVFTSSALALEKVDLRVEAFKYARGAITITEEGKDQRRLELSAGGLEPNALYSVWFAGEKPGQRSSVGTESTFRSDSQGNATFSTVVSENELEKWDKFQVAYHPDGDLTNFRGAVVSLSGDLPEGG